MYLEPFQDVFCGWLGQHLTFFSPFDGLIKINTFLFECPHWGFWRDHFYWWKNSNLVPPDAGSILFEMFPLLLLTWPVFSLSFSSLSNQNDLRLVLVWVRKSHCQTETWNTWSTVQREDEEMTHSSTFCTFLKKFRQCETGVIGFGFWIRVESNNIIALLAWSVNMFTFGVFFRFIPNL